MGVLLIATGEKAEADLQAMEGRLRHRTGGRSPCRPRVRETRMGADRPPRSVPAALAGTLPPAPEGAAGREVTRIFEIPAARSVTLPEGEPQVVLCDGHPPDAFTLAAVWEDGSILLARDPLGLRPLYYLEEGGRPVAFASEVKALCALGDEIKVFPPGHVFVNGEFHRLVRLADWVSESDLDASSAAARLARLVEDAVERGYASGVAQPAGAGEAAVGLLLSGGVDSSVVAAAAVARLGSEKLLSFAAGTSDSEDLPRARQVAEHLGLRHTEYVFGVNEVAEVLPDVIYHLESFDAPLVRSSVANYLIAREAAAAGCRLVYCGEGGDELFAGYHYLKDIEPRDRVTDELLVLLEGGHANGFQRVDRMTAAHGLEARVPLSAPDLVAAAFQVPVDWKIHPETGQEKWLLREAFRDRLPHEVVERPKAKFYEGSGIEGVMARVAETQVSDADLEKDRGREVAPGVTLDTKEQVLYYRIFREHFPQESVVETIGWTRTVVS